MPETTESKPAFIHELEALKLVEETELLKVDRILRAAEAKKAEADTRRELAKAEEAEYYRDAARISRDTAIRQEQAALSGDHYAREYMFSGAIGPKSVAYCLDQLTLWHRIDEKELGNAEEYRPMHIIMCSEGGDVISGFQLFDQILAFSKRGRGKHEITMTVRGYAASMAGILLQAADRRVMGPSAHLLIHEVSAWAEGSMGALKDKMKWLDMMSEQVVDLYIKRANGKLSKDEFVSRWNRTDWWLSAVQALELGLIDEIG